MGIRTRAGGDVDAGEAQDAVIGKAKAEVSTRFAFDAALTAGFPNVATFCMI